MKNPFITLMPLRTDLRIRLRLLRAGWSRRRSNTLWGGALLAVPALALFLFLIVPQGPVDSEQALVRTIKVAQQAELARSNGGIYHVTRVIAEGKDKPSFVEKQLGSEIDASPRVDVVTTWQHNDTVLAMIESNGTKKPFEVFLSREHDGALTLHHYAEGAQNVAPERVAYDTAHDLASLYTAYTSLEQPAIPVLPDEATLLKLSLDTDQARFVTEIAGGLSIESVVDLKTYLVVEEIIYITVETGERFEMTRVSYTNRELVPAEQFENIFNPNQYRYEIIATG